jgi:hypothetical protein
LIEVALADGDRQYVEPQILEFLGAEYAGRRR